MKNNEKTTWSNVTCWRWQVCPSWTFDFTAKLDLSAVYLDPLRVGSKGHCRDLARMLSICVFTLSAANISLKKTFVKHRGRRGRQEVWVTSVLFFLKGETSQWENYSLKRDNTALINEIIVFWERRNYSFSETSTGELESEAAPRHFFL